MAQSALQSLENGNDDSFVILGSSPPISLTQESTTTGTSMSLINVPQQSLVQNTPLQVSNGENKENISLQNGHESVQGQQSFKEPVSLDKSFASNFLLGKIDCKSLQTSIIEQFPSMTGSQMQIDDMMKLSCIIEENKQFKENLEKTNIAMRRQFTILQEYQNNVKKRMLEKNKLIDDLKKELDTVKQEKSVVTQELQQLKQKLDETVENYNAFEVSVKKEISDLVMKVSEKDAIIQNIHMENERLQLEKADFVVLKNNKPEKSFEPADYIKKSDHDAEIKNLKREMSALLAENLEFKDMKKVYTDELNCLKVNVTAAEELHKDMRDTIAVLRTRDQESLKRAEDAETQLKAVQDEIGLLKVQVEIYQKDFNMEREAREKLVTEKDNILSELQLLKMRNKQLIDDAQERLRGSPQPGNSATTQNQTTSSNAVNGATPPRSSKSASPESENQKVRFICPICNQELKTLRLLEQHIDICLKD